MVPYLVYIALQLILLLANISTSAVSVAFPNIITTFNTSLVLSGWVLSIYLLISISSAVLVGKIGDIFGKKRTFVVCVGLFVLGSFLATISPNIYCLIFARFIQGIGGGGLTPISVGIFTELFPNHRQRVLALSMGISNAGGIIGPSIGAWLLSTWGWRAIFWFNIPIGILVGISIMILLNTDQGRRDSYIDLKGIALFIAALFSMMIGLSQINAISWSLVILLLLASVIFIALFVRQETKSKDPIIDLNLIKRRQFASAHFFNFCIGAFAFSFTSFTPLFAISVYHLTAMQSGIILSFRFIGTITAAFVSSVLLVRWGYHRPLIIGSLLVALSVIFMGIESPQIGILNTDLKVIIAYSIVGVVSGIGFGITSPAILNVLIDLEPQSASKITGLVGMFTYCGGTISIAITTLILQYTADSILGFEISFVAMGCLLLSTLPFLFALPDRTSIYQAKEKV